MTRAEFVHNVALACGHMEGFFITEQQAREQKIMWPTIAQRNGNPVNLRAWGSFPIVDKYAKFPGPPLSAWANVEMASAQCVEGWKAAQRQCERNIFDRPLTFVTFFAGERDALDAVIPGGYSGFAPSGDKNSPLAYAKFVVQFLAGVLQRSDFDENTKISDVFAKVQ